MTPHLVRTISELRAVLAATPDTTLVTLPASIVRQLVKAAELPDGLQGRGA